MKIKKILCLVLVGSMISSVPVFATENTEEENVITILNEEADNILFEDLAEQETIIDSDDFISADILSERFNLDFESSSIMALDSTGDQYEPNNSIETATTGLSGKKITATLHEGDVDWYKLEVVDTSQPYSFVLMNIPSGCDYDMLLINSDLTSGYAQFQDGNTNEEFYININQAGTYYVAVQANVGYSDTPYTLYFGPAYKTSSTGWRDPNLSFSFGYVPRGSAAKSVPAQSYNLTNDTTIPDGAVLTSLMITADGNAADWAGFYKYIAEPSGYGMQQIGNLPTFNVPDMAYYVKQNWSIWGTIEYSTYFVWEPQIYMGYKFIVTPQTMRFVN